jgi:hypothetical protein
LTGHQGTVSKKDQECDEHNDSGAGIRALAEIKEAFIGLGNQPNNNPRQEFV